MFNVPEEAETEVANMEYGAALVPSRRIGSEPQKIPDVSAKYP